MKVEHLDFPLKLFTWSYYFLKAEKNLPDVDL